MLRGQRDALIAAIEDVEDISSWGDSETMKFREKQIESLDGIVNLLDAMLDNAEGFGDWHNGFCLARANLWNSLAFWPTTEKG